MVIPALHGLWSYGDGRTHTYLLARKGLPVNRA
jgi:hypothetical protein